MKRLTLAAAAAVAFAAAPVAIHAQVVAESVDLGVIERIREEGLERSQIDALAHQLTDVIGPRLTGSPAMRQANEWAVDQLTDWGLVNGMVEPWGEFGRGWERVSYHGTILTPVRQPLNAQPVAWTAGTNGTVSGHVVVVEGGPDSIGRYADQLRGAFVLMSAPPEITPEFEHVDRRTPVEQLLEPIPAPTGPQAPRQRTDWDALIQRIGSQQATQDSMIRSYGVLGIISPSSRPNGIIRGGGKFFGRFTQYQDPLPELVVSQEQYNEMYRNVLDGRPVAIEVNVENRFYEDDLTSYNSVADIPGGDLADEYIMVGAHLDSWHYGTGATDNGAGTIVMMEAMRILKALNLQPRRTIRIGLWSGEEQGLWGSRKYVENHPELHSQISAYLNLDNGTGKIRGIWDQSNTAAAPVFEQILWPFEDLGVVAVRHGNTGGTDHLSFDGYGIPGFNFIQDPIEYRVNTHHTNLDTYDHLVLDDLRQAAVVVAATAYHLAMRDEMMPRKEELTQ